LEKITSNSGRPNIFAARFPTQIATAFIVPKNPLKFCGAISETYNGPLKLCIFHQFLIELFLIILILTYSTKVTTLLCQKKEKQVN